MTDSEESRVRSRESGVRSPDSETQSPESGGNPSPLKLPTPDPRLPTPGVSLVVDGLWKSFTTPAGDRLEVLRAVSFTVAAGEMIAIVGASGAGKSTLLHVLGGLEAADGGRAQLGQFEMTHTDDRATARFRNREVGFVFQFHHLLRDLTAVENVALPLMIARRRSGEARAAAARMLARVGLAGRAAHTVGELSGGEQQRVAIARALVTGPRLVLADEPTGNLDAQTGEDVGALLLALCREHNSAVVVATHNEHLAGACDRVMRLRNGALEMSDDVS